jgi:hypothetical protein
MFDKLFDVMANARLISRYMFGVLDIHYIIHLFICFFNPFVGLKPPIWAETPSILRK